MQGNDSGMTGGDPAGGAGGVNVRRSLRDVPEKEALPPKPPPEPVIDPVEVAMRRKMAMFLSPGVRPDPLETILPLADGRRVPVEVEEIIRTESAAIMIFEDEIGIGVAGRAVDEMRHGLDLAARAGFPDQLTRKRVAPMLPDLLRRIDLSENGAIHAFDRPAGFCSFIDFLRDIRAHGTRPHPRELVWIVSALIDLECWLEWAGILHFEIWVETLLIDPVARRLILCGGWENAIRVGEPPPPSLSMIPPQRRTKTGVQTFGAGSRAPGVRAPTINQVKSFAQYLFEIDDPSSRAVLPSDLVHFLGEQRHDHAMRMELDWWLMLHRIGWSDTSEHGA